MPGRHLIPSPGSKFKNISNSIYWKDILLRIFDQVRQERVPVLYLSTFVDDIAILAIGNTNERATNKV